MEIYKETNTAASKEFEKLLDNQISKTQSLIEGKIIEGTVTKVGEKYVWLHTDGLKSEAMIDINELKTLGLENKVKIGEKIQVLLERIEDKNGVLLEDFSPTTREVFSPEVAYTVVNLLEGVTESGTGIRLRHSGGKYRYNVVTDYPYNFTNPIAGKTGTTQNNSDGWFIGMVPNLITGIWTGCQDRSAHFGITEFGQGATTALPIWAILMKDLYKQPNIGISQGDFEKPKGPMSIALDCNSYLKQSLETDNEQSEYN